MNAKLLKKTMDLLFATEEEMDQAKVDEAGKKRILRLRGMYSYWVANPHKTPHDIYTELRTRYKIGDSKAYEDVAFLKMALGEINKCSRDYHLWVFVQRCEEGFKMAREKSDPSAFAKVLGVYGKYTRLDRDEGNVPDYSLIVPQQFDITTDPEAAGFKRIPNIEEKADKWLHQFVIEAEAEVVGADSDEVQPLPEEKHFEKS